MFDIFFVIELLIIFIEGLSAKEMEHSTEDGRNYWSSQIKQLNKNSKKYHELLKAFLTHFKTYPCTINQTHDPQFCYFYHDSTDRRRNPYQNHHFLYNFFQICMCTEPQCPHIHNQYESLYHPLLYKTSHCLKGQLCDYGLYCYHSHPQDLFHFQYGEFFRFDLRTFKTQKCYNKNHHQRKTCLYYHNDKDKRRPSNVLYSHFYCDKEKCTNELCQFSHNKLEQLYHLNRYKTKFCQFFPNQIQKCEYKSFCSFAHTQDQIIENIQLIHLLYKNTDFYIQKYKTVWCPFTQNHQRDKCPYAHNIQDFRRNPKENIYEALKCQFWNFSDEIKSIQGAGCKFGMECKKCHGWMQYRYHPSRYPNKRSTSVKKQDIETAQNIVNKKIPDFALLNECRSKGKGNTNPQIIKTNYSKGTPFFKNERSSEYSVKTKAKSSNFESEKSNDGSSNKDRAKTTLTKIIPGLSVFPYLTEGEEEINWESQYGKISQPQDCQKQENSGRSKSAQKSEQYEANYSNSIKDTVNDAEILKQLQKRKFNEIQIMNMDQNKINKLSFLTAQQKNALAMKLKIYSIRQSNAIKYSKELTKYFISKKKQSILQKMQLKRVKQVKLLKLAAKQINDLSFLEAEQKSLLPKLLRQYRDNKEFNELNQRIEEETKMTK